MEVRRREGMILLGHAPGRRDYHLKVQVPREFPQVDPSLARLGGDAVQVETFIFEIAHGVILVDEQDPYIIPGFIPCGKALSIGIDNATPSFGAWTYERVKDFVQTEMVRLIAEEIVKHELMTIEELKSDRAELRKHRFSVWITKGS